MKRLLSLLLSLAILISAIIVPISVHSDVAMTYRPTETEVIVNNYEEADLLSKHTVGGTQNLYINKTGNSIKTNADATNTKEMYFGAMSTNSDQQSAVKVYDNRDENYKLFVPEKNTSYKLTAKVWYKGAGSGDMFFRVYGNTEASSFKGEKLGQTQMATGNDSYYHNGGSATRKSRAITVYFTTGDTELNSISLNLELDRAAAAGGFPSSIDEVVIEKTSGTPVLLNTYEEAAVNSYDKLKTKGVIPSGAPSSVKPMNSGALPNDTSFTKYLEFGGTNYSHIGTVTRAVKLYNNDTGNTIFKPEKNGVYKLTADFYFKGPKTPVLQLNVYGNKTEGDSFKGDLLATAYEVKPNDANYYVSSGNSRYYWRQVTVYIDTKDVQYESFSLVPELVNTASSSTDDSNFRTKIDNIALEKVSTAAVAVNNYEGVEIADGIALLKGSNVQGLSSAAQQYKAVSSTAIQNNRSKFAVFYGVDSQDVASLKTFVKIYDSKTANAYVPEKNTKYKVSLKWYAKKASSKDLSLMAVGHYADGTTKDLGVLYTIPTADTSYSTQRWLSVSSEFTVGEDEFTAVSVAVRLHNPSTATTGGFESYIDDIILEKVGSTVPPKDVIVNTYDDVQLSNLSHYDATKISLDSELNSKVLFIQRFMGINKSEPNRSHIKIYNPEESFASYSPKKNKVYKLTFDYKAKQANDYDLKINVIGISGAVTKDEDILASAVTIKSKSSGDTSHATAEWKNAITYIYTGDNVYGSIGLATVVNGGGATTESWNGVYLDNVKLEELDTTHDITFHNTDNNSNTEVIAVNNAAHFDTYRLPATPEGKRFAGFYTDSGCTALATGYAIDTTELWVKWEDKLPAGIMSNTYDEFGISKDLIDGSRVTEFGVKDTENSTNVAVIDRYAGDGYPGGEYDSYIKIYNPDDSFNLFVPEPNSAYKITFDYKSYRAKKNNLTISVVGADGDGISGKQLANIVTMNSEATGDETYAEEKWRTATGYFATGAIEYAGGIALKFTAVDNNTASATRKTYLDNIKIEKIEPSTVNVSFVNLYGDGETVIKTISNGTTYEQFLIDEKDNLAIDGKQLVGFYYNSGYTEEAKGYVYNKPTTVYAYWLIEFEIHNIVNTYDDVVKTQLSHYDATKIEPDTEKNSKAVFVQRFMGYNRTEPNRSHIKIYNPKDDFALYAPLKNRVYKLSFDYKVKQANDFDLKINAIGVNGAVTKDSDVLATAVTIKSKISGDTSHATAEWKSATAYIYTDDADYEAIGLAFVVNSGNTDAQSWNGVYLDNVKLQLVETVHDITFHNTDNNSKTEIISVNNASRFDTYRLPVTPDGKRFAGYYIDSGFTTLAEGYVIDTAEVWVKWEDKAPEGTVINTYDEFGISQDLIDGSRVTEFGVKDTDNLTNVAVIDRYAGDGYPGGAYDSFIKIYNPDDSFKLFKPENNTVYRITFDFKSYRAKNNDLAIEVIGTDGYGIIGEKLTSVVTMRPEKSGDTTYAEEKWRTATGYFATGDTEFAGGIALKFTAIDNNTASATRKTYLDNIKIEKIAPTTDIEFVNLYGDGITLTKSVSNGLKFEEYAAQINESTNRYDGKKLVGFFYDANYKQKATGYVYNNTATIYALWQTEFEINTIVNTYDDVVQTQLSHYDASKIEFNEELKSNTLYIQRFMGINKSEPNRSHVKIYDPNNNDKLYKPLNDRVYKVTFDYNAVHSNTFDLKINVIGVDGSVRKDTDVLATAVTVKSKASGDTEHAKREWKKATAYIYTADKDYSAIGLAPIVNGGDEKTEFWTGVYLDNVKLELVETSHNITFHNTDNMGKTEVINVNNAARFDSYKLAYAPEGKRFGGYYYDSEYKKIATGYMINATELWVKWDDRQPEGTVINTYDEFGVTSETIVGSQVSAFGVMDTENTTNVAVIDRYAGDGYVGGQYDSFIKLYNPDDDFELFKLDSNSAYKITFDYKTRQATRYDLTIDVVGTYGDGILGDRLATAVKMKSINSGNSTYAAEEWRTATVYFATGDKDYAGGLALKFTAVNDSSASTNRKTYLDNIIVEKIEATTDIKFVNLYGDGKTVTKTLSNATTFEQFAIDEYENLKRDDKKFISFYFDSEYKNIAYGYIYGTATTVYALWRTEDEMTKVVNTYDDKGVSYAVNESFKDGTEPVAAEGEILDPSQLQYLYSQRFNSDNKNIDASYKFNNFGKGYVENGDTSNHFRFTAYTEQSATHLPNSAAVRIYDNNDRNYGLFVPRKNTIYKVTLKYKVTKSFYYATRIDLRGLTDNEGSFGSGINFGTVVNIPAQASYNSWQTASAYITTDDSDFCGIALYSVSTGKGKTGMDIQLLIDDVVIEEVYDTNMLFMHYNDKYSTVDRLGFVPEQEPLKLTVPTNCGQVFEGWYTDESLTSQFSLTKMPTEDTHIYAKWVTLEKNPYDIEIGFNEKDFKDNKIPYGNGVNDNKNSATVKLITDDKKSYNGNYLRFENTKGAISSSNKLSVIQLVNKDGTPYQFVSNNKYRISLAVRANETARVAFVVNPGVPTTVVNAASPSSSIWNLQYDGLWYHDTNTWGEISKTLTATASGKAFLVVYGTASTVDIDNIKIEALDVDEYVTVTYQYPNSKGTMVSSGKVYEKGELLVAPNPTNFADKQFTGWVEKDSGEPFITQYAPDKSITVVATYGLAVDTSNVKKGLTGKHVFDFDKEVVKAAAFYGSGLNSFSHNYATTSVDCLVTGDKSAHSGENFMYFRHCGSWVSEQEFTVFKVFNPDSNSPGNFVYLEPGSVYKVKLMMKVDKISSGGLKVVAFENSPFKPTGTASGAKIVSEEFMFNLTEADLGKNMGQWTEMEATLVTGSDITVLGFLIRGGYLTGAIDTITVEKLEQHEIKFESNCGFEIESKYAYVGDYIVAPAVPDREGYVFDAWYTDKQLTKKFKFNKTPISGDMTLYAGWKLAEKDVYRDEITYIEEEQIVPNENYDPTLDEQINIQNTDTIIPVTETETAPWVLIAGITGGALLLIIAAAIILIVVVKKKRKA